MRDPTPRSLRAQIGPFAMVPLWILDRCRDSRAIHLYALLGKYANRERRAWPKLETLAEEMDVVQRTVERAIATLRGAGALQTERRRRADGSVLGLDFLLIHTLPDDGLPDTGVGLRGASLPDMGVGLLPLALPDTSVGLGGGLPDTSVGTLPTPVSGYSVQEPDPLEPDRTSSLAAASASDPTQNVGVITKLAHEVCDLYDGVADLTYAELEDAVTARCALYAIAQTRDVVIAALESALFQRRRAGKPSLIAGAAGEAAWRFKDTG